MRLFYLLLYKMLLIDTHLAEERGDHAAYRDYLDRADSIRVNHLL